MVHLHPYHTPYLDVAEGAGNLHRLDGLAVVWHGGVGIDPLRVGHCTVAAVAAQHILCGDGSDEFGLRRWGGWGL